MKVVRKIKSDKNFQYGKNNDREVALYRKMADFYDIDITEKTHIMIKLEVDQKALNYRKK